MQILIVAATNAEIAPLIAPYDKNSPFDVLITGVGMVATAYAMGNFQLLNQYGLVVNLGIAGSFDRSLALGEVVEIIDDTLSEFGAEDDERFIPIEAMGFGESRFYPSAGLDSYLEVPELKKVTAITVNTVHGSEASINQLTGRLPVNLESMEGAAFFYACGKAKVPCLQIRAVSNYVEKRNRDNWQIGLAIKNLNNFAISLIDTISARA